ncbi:DUF6447 family protein [Zoogloea sp.]|uniref:DUF6447 family protein n=1 Tax=Zoogloea sp. TaxID=49181 RepID=UPI002636A13E|nr:DUF6447 family protein [Zoogloea sp.]MDD3354924.1 DUF6447 family protein [Zoogloea sp.]
MALPEYVTLNGTQYATANLNDAAREQVGNIQAVDEEIARLQRQLAIAQTARNAYVAALLAAVKHKEEAPVEDKPKKPRTKRKTKEDAAE